jgi:hypothetical protein
MKLNYLLILCSFLFLGAVRAKAEVLVPVGRVSQTVAVPNGSHALQPVYPSPYPYPNQYPYPYGGYPRYSSFGMSLSIGGFGGPGFVGGRPLLGRRCRRCVRRCSRSCSRGRRCF